MHNIFLVDLPANALWQTLCDEFPEAKVILVVRDEDKWINSLLNHIDVSFHFLIFGRFPVRLKWHGRIKSGGANQKWKVSRIDRSRFKFLTETWWSNNRDKRLSSPYKTVVWSFTQN